MQEIAILGHIICQEFQPYIKTKQKKDENYIFIIYVFLNYSIDLTILPIYLWVSPNFLRPIRIKRRS